MPSTFTNLLYHIVFSTKNRQPLITEQLQSELYNYLGGIIRNEGGKLIEVGGVADHVHLLLKLKPTICLSDFMRVLKGNSSKWANERATGKFEWQEGYSAFSVSESQVPRLVSYIRNQAEHHKTISFQDELQAILDRHGVEYDLKYL